jgi:predicted AlkP superfamily pyrophosphatase or phosphodiesterase
MSATPQTAMRPRRLIRHLLDLLILAAAGAISPLSAQSARGRVIILVVDGLRPDYVTAEFMPRLDALARRGVRGLAHHSVYPTVTRVNASSIFTGSYPDGHGIMGNSVYLPEVDADHAISTQQLPVLRAIRDAFDGALFTTTPLAELLERQGLVFFGTSSGSPGTGMLMNPTGAGAGLVHNEFTLPDSLGAVVDEVLGPLPEIAPGTPFLPLVSRAVDALLEIGLDRADAGVLGVWLTEPDHSTHGWGIGAPRSIELLRGVDAEIGRLLDGLQERGLLETTDILVTSDHGFSTRTGTTPLVSLLVDAGLKSSQTSTDVVLAGDAIHVNEGGPERVRSIVELLQRTEWIGAVFTRGEGDSDAGWVDGTLSLRSVRWDHPRSGDILATGNWTDAVNEYGFAGAVILPGVASHGSLAPSDLHATFIAAGPSIKKGVQSRVPTANVDLAPTVLALVGAEPSAEMAGRALTEILLNGPDPAAVPVIDSEVDADVVLGTIRYRVVLHRSAVDGHEYIDYAGVERSAGR